jgi:transposase-like protein/5-methylcytosine-specific restriction endonuclease McrA
MEREWLAAQLEAGQSIESIARDVGRSPSTVAYWVNKHGLASQHAAKHSALGGIQREVLAALVEEGLSVRQIARSQQRSPTTVRHWLRKFGLKTRPPTRLGKEFGLDEMIRECNRHGWTLWIRVGSGRYRCKRCRLEAVSARRRRVKEILVAEAGGCCQLCGYDRYAGALQFHHVDPADKEFALASRGLARSLAKARVEVAKCVLLCGNCHAEVEAGLATIPACTARRSDSRER